MPNQSDRRPPARAATEATISEGRRSFVKVFGLATAAATTLVKPVAEAAAQEQPKPAAPARAESVGPSETKVSLTINGKPMTVEVEPRVTLSSLLRSRLGITGAKDACDRGACGSCTVIVNGSTRAACMTLVVDLEGASVTTVEGLASSTGELHAVQQRFIDKDALQCGYCTPGMVVSCFALLQRNPKPTVNDVKEATAGNICRCGTYGRVCEATLAAATDLSQRRGR